MNTRIERDGNINLPDIRHLVERSIVKSLSCSKGGLVNYQLPSLKDYDRMNKNGTFYLAKSNDGLVGFLDVYKAKNLEYLFGECEILNPVKSIASTDFLYLNTLVIASNYRNRGIASKILGSVKDDNRNLDLWGAVCHKTIFN